MGEKKRVAAYLLALLWATLAELHESRIILREPPDTTLRKEDLDMLAIDLAVPVPGIHIDDFLDGCIQSDLKLLWVLPSKYVDILSGQLPVRLDPLDYYRQHRQKMHFLIFVFRIYPCTNIWNIVVLG